jgi:CBS domain-containing protein
MALTVRDIKEADPVTVGPEEDVETLVRQLRRHELPGVPVVNEGDATWASSPRPIS